MMPLPLFALEDPTVKLNESHRQSQIMPGPQSLPPFVTSKQQHQSTTSLDTKVKLISDDDLHTRIGGMEATSIQHEDSRVVLNVTYPDPPTVSVAEDMTGVIEAPEQFADFTNDDYMTTTESGEYSADFYDDSNITLKSATNSEDFNNQNTQISLKRRADTSDNHSNKTLTLPPNDDKTGESIDNLRNIKEMESEEVYAKAVITNIPTSSGITSNKKRGTLKQLDINKFSTDVIPDSEEYDQSTTHPPPPAPIGTDTNIVNEDYEWSTHAPSMAENSNTVQPPPTTGNIDILPNNEEFDWFGTHPPTLTVESSDTVSDYEEYDWLVNHPTATDSTDTISGDEYDWSMTEPPASTAVTLEESLMTDLMNSTDTRDQKLMLEASPITEVVADTTKNPLDLANFDVRIMTTREGLQVDVHDDVFDPSQIAKATSYEGSSYSTATRSATVTTWVDPGNKHLFTHQQVNSTKSENLGDSAKLETVVKPETSFKNSHNSKVLDSDIGMEPPEKDFENKFSTDKYQEVTSHELASDTVFTTDIEFLTEVNTEPTSVASVYVHNSDTEVENKKLLEVTPKNGVGNNDRNKFAVEGIPMVTHNITDFGNNTQILMKDSKNKTEDSLIYELPVPDTARNTGTHLTPSVVIALSVCCSIVLLLGILSILLWLCRRHRNRSKIYLSHEVAKPRAFFTKPMNPALLPNENMPESVYMLEFQRPRAPVLLSNDQRDLYFIEHTSVSESLRVENTAVGVDTAVGVENNGFIDIPLGESKTENIHNSKKYCGQDPPKYDFRYKCESDSDSGIKVWSSTGSLYTAASQLTQCSLPPPPYSPSIGEESLCLSVHSLPSLSKKTGILNV